jgi:hypothetical protein
MLGRPARGYVGGFGRWQRGNLISELLLVRLQCRDALRYLAVFGGELFLIGGNLLDCFTDNGEIKCYRLQLLPQFRRTRIGAG